MRFKAVTLIELIVTIAIIGILLAAAVPMVAKSNKADGVKNEAQRLVTFIQRAKNFAQNPEAADAESYQVVKDTNGFYKIKRCTKMDCNFVVEELQLTKATPSGWSDLTYAVYDGKYSGVSPIPLVLSRDDAKATIRIENGQPNIATSE